MLTVFKNLTEEQIEHLVQTTTPLVVGDFTFVPTEQIGEGIEFEVYTTYTPE